MTSTRTLTIRILRTFPLILATATLLATLAATAPAQNPVPFIDQPLVPDATAPGGPAFTLTVNGAGFVPASVVNWNASPRATTFVSSSQLTAKILASDVAKASTAAVTVVNPNPGGISNTQFFSVAVPKTAISFAPAVTYNSGGIYPGSLVVADVNGDGKPDMMVANFGGTSSIGVLLGNGDGTFQPATMITNIGSVAEVNALAVADVNGDGKLDLIVATCCESNGDAEAAVLLGNGDGTFRAPLFYDANSASEATVALAVADLNGDGKPDIVEVNWSPSTVRVLLGNGDGTFQPAMTSSAPADPGCLTISDVNKDGIPDLLICSQNSIAVLLGNGNGTFQPFTNTNFHTGNCTPAVAIADVNGDGLPDMVDANAGPDSCGPVGFAGILLGNGDGTFQSEVNYLAVNYTHDGVGQAAVGDVNGDGNPDVVVASGMGLYIPVQGSVGVLLGNGDGTFQAPASFGAGGVFSYSVVVADVNGDGRPDILVANFASSTVAVLLNNSESSNPTTATTLASTPEPSIFGQPVTFTAAVTSASGPPTGTVVFTDTSTSTTLGSAALISGTASISISSLAAGTQSITAAYQGSATFSASTSAPLSQIVKIASTTTSLTSSLNPAATGQSITFTATVTGQYGGAATGSVTFLSGSQTLGTATLSGNRAILTTSFATAGTYSISAKYNGDGNNTGSTSSTLSQVVAAATTTALVSSLNPSLIGQAVTFTATVRSTAGTPPNGEIVTFYSASAVLGTAPLSGGIASLTTSSLPAGIYTITAAYSGDATFAPSTSPGLRQVVNSTTKSATSTTLISSLNPSIYGQKVTWTAVVTTSGPVPPTGKVNFTWGDSIGTATLNASGIATLTRSALNANTYPLTAVYEGDANNLRSASVVLSQVVSEATSAATLTSSPNPSTAGQSVTFTATITSPTVAATGPVTFTAGKTVLGTAQLANGKATFTISTLAVGTTTVTATYYGDSNISGSSASVRQTVGPAASLIEDDGKLPIQSKTTRSTSAGGCYSSTTLTTSGSPNLVGNQVVFTASVNAAGYCNNQPQGSCYEPITFYDGNTVIGSVPLNRACIASFTDNSLTAKTHKIKAYFPGTGEGDAPSYSNAVTQVITGYPTATTLSSSLTPSAYGQSVTWTATVTSPSPFGYLTMPTGKVEFSWGGVYTIGTATLNASGVATLTKSNLNADSYPLTATYVGDPNNAGSTSATLAQVVTPTTSAATLTSSPNPGTEGQAVTFLASITSPTIEASGPVTFSIGNTVLGTAELVGGKARFTTSTLPVGANPVTVNYSGDSNISGSSVSVTEIVQP